VTGLNMAFSLFEKPAPGGAGGGLRWSYRDFLQKYQSVHS
jgi:hypothetical protein